MIMRKHCATTPGEFMRLHCTRRISAATPTTLFTLLLLHAATTSAQTPPDAGRLLQEQPKPPAAPAAIPTPIKPEVVVPEAEAGPTVQVKGFRIQGAVLVPASELTELLQPLVGRELSLRQIQAAASQLTAYYLSRGYLARVIVPPQDIQDGIVTLQVIEGKRGALDVQSHDAKLDSARIQRFIDQRMQNGDAFDIRQLNTALTVLNEQPGVKVGSSLKPGQQDGAIDLLISASAKPLLDVNLGANNHGSRGTGELQTSGGITLNNPTGNFDALSLTANFSDGTEFGRADYSLAIGNSGLRLGVNGSTMRYRLTQSAFAALQGRGTADTMGLTASYPLARDTDFNLSLVASMDGKHLIDYTVVGETGNRKVITTTVSLNGYSMGEQGTTSFGVNLINGDSNQRNPGALAADLGRRQVQGNFTKLGYNVNQLLPLGADWRLSAGLRGQFASRNLDSGERMGLGGPTAVRAYPTGEASGDEAWLLNLNLSRQIGDTLTGNLFLDAGGVTINRKLWAGWNLSSPNLRNRYELAGAGLSLDWRIGPALLLNATVATPLGNNPGRDINRLNTDGSVPTHARGWISLTAQF
jgi:hemolysin activation/secretion protein